MHEPNCKKKPHTFPAKNQAVQKRCMAHPLGNGHVRVLRFHASHEQRAQAEFSVPTCIKASKTSGCTVDAQQQHTNTHFPAMGNHTHALALRP